MTAYRRLLETNTGGKRRGYVAVTLPDEVLDSLSKRMCIGAGGATWLQIETPSGGSRPVVTPTLGPDWGLHLDDVNLALGNLVYDVAAEEMAYSAHHQTP